ncbi:MAG: polyprenyl synthetase family protein [Bacteroidota bacterium]|jgi:geranylgeranyl diphosphate synthase type II|nr:polyprenyl synthetase family protein [Bacteroidota bacterium]HHU97614.1 polyprenyl synthetase family protein [Petrimonas sp.]
MSDKISRYESKIDEAVRKVLEGEQPRTLFEPVRYILGLGGKRLRPLLVLLSVDLFDGDPAMALSPAVAIEIFHNFSLVHDDLMDRAAIRRGHPTVHEKWGTNVAILSGDAMVFEAYRQLAQVPSRFLPAVMELFTTTALEVCKGQQHDMDFERRDQVAEEEYLEMIRLKTAVLIGCSLKMGAILAETSAENANVLYGYGENMGLAFQLRDDLLDVYGDPRTFGKRVGGDILCNKKTYLLIKALENANPMQRQELNRWLSAEEYQPEAKIEAIKQVYDELNLKAVVEKLIQRYYHASLECLALVQVSDDRKQLLADLAEGLMYREK